MKGKLIGYLASAVFVVVVLYVVFRVTAIKNLVVGTSAPTAS